MIKVPEELKFLVTSPPRMGEDVRSSVKRILGALSSSLGEKAHH